MCVKDKIQIYNMGKKKRGKKKNGLKNIKSSEVLPEEISPKNDKDFRIFNSNYLDIQNSLNKNIGDDFSSIDRIFSHINSHVAKDISHNWTKWIDN